MLSIKDNRLCFKNLQIGPTVNEKQDIVGWRVGVNVMQADAIDIGVLVVEGGGVVRVHYRVVSEREKGVSSVANTRQ